MSSNQLIFPSVLAANSLRLEAEIHDVMQAGADGIHLDIMDNHYVPNLSFGPAICQDIRKTFPELLVDVHLMVSPAERMVEAFADSGASRLSIHPDACKRPEKTLRWIQSQNIKAGVVLNPDTPFQVIHDYIHALDFILVMTVQPGFGNQAFMPEVLPKIEMLAKTYPSLPIAVDGGVNANNLKRLSQAKATQFIMGSAIFNTKNYTNTLNYMRKELSE